MIFKVFKNNSYAIAYGVQQLLKHTVTWKLISIFQKGLIDCFSILHREAMAGAHKGPAFLPWHRVFIAL